MLGCWKSSIPRKKAWKLQELLVLQVRSLPTMFTVLNHSIHLSQGAKILYKILQSKSSMKYDILLLLKLLKVRKKHFALNKFIK